MFQFGHAPDPPSPKELMAIDCLFDVRETKVGWLRVGSKGIPSFGAHGLPFEHISLLSTSQLCEVQTTRPSSLHFGTSFVRTQERPKLAELNGGGASESEE